jgi:protocatechuate 3,4-dioxygenase alpha subunit
MPRESASASRGVVIDGIGSPIKDVLLEVWQANADGHYAHPEGGGPVEDGFRGWGRVITDFDTGAWGFDTVKPGKTKGRDVGVQAPHINLWIVARGINIGLNTRMYFGDEVEANAADPVLNLIEWENRRSTLIAARDAAACSHLPVQDAAGRRRNRLLRHLRRVMT